MGEESSADGWLVKKHTQRGVHRRLPGMLLHLDGSSHAWFQDDRRYNLLFILDDATSAIYYAQLVEQESTATVMTALREVIEQKALFVRYTVIEPAISFILPRPVSPWTVPGRRKWAGLCRNWESR